MELNDLLEDAQDFTYTLLRDYGYSNHELIEQWFEANHQWEITFTRLNMAISLMDDLLELLEVKLTHKELDSLKEKREGLVRGRRLFDVFYREADQFITRNLQYSAWLHQFYMGPKKMIFDLNKHTSEDPWWERQASLSQKAGDKLRAVLIAEDPKKARAAVIRVFKVLQRNIVDRSAALGVPSDAEVPGNVMPLGKLSYLFDSLEVDHMFFD
jgi:hypothetical protein